MRYDTIACLAVVASLAGCGVGAVRGMPPEPTTTVAAEISTAETLSWTAFQLQCRAWAPDIEEDEVPMDHDGERLVAFTVSSEGLGCGHYADGWNYDGLGWIAP